jgi:hypothetical protein
MAPVSIIPFIFPARNMKMRTSSFTARATCPVHLSFLGLMSLGRRELIKKRLVMQGSTFAHQNSKVQADLYVQMRYTLEAAVT